MFLTMRQKRDSYEEKSDVFKFLTRHYIYRTIPTYSFIRVQYSSKFQKIS